MCEPKYRSRISRLSMSSVTSVSPLHVNNTVTPRIADLIFRVVRHVPTFEHKFELRSFFDPKCEVNSGVVQFSIDGNPCFQSIFLSKVFSNRLRPFWTEKKSYVFPVFKPAESESCFSVKSGVAQKLNGSNLPANVGCCRF